MVADTFCSFSLVSIAIAIAAVVISSVYCFFKNRDLPPGPIGLPLFGYWPFLRDNTCGEQLDKLKQKYGDIFSFWSAGRLYINLGTVKAVREAHISKGEAFGGRYTDFNLLAYVLKDGVGFANGEAWKVLRKFFLQVMRDRGIMSIRDSMSGCMYESVHSLVEDLKKNQGEPVNMIELVTEKCGRILRDTLFEENSLTMKEVIEINEMYAGVMSGMTATNLLLTGNFARYFIFPFKSSFWVTMRCHKKVVSILKRIVDEHKSTYDEEHTRDVIDDFFKERDLRRSKGDPTARHFTDKALVSSLEQLIGDGVLSVAGFVCLLIKSFLDHPEEQKKVYEEIMEVVGADRQPNVEDKNKLIYTNAFLLETLRMAEFLPIIPSLECTKETILRGFRIPKGAITLVNAHSSHFDPEEFENPRKFNPSRYIQEEGKRRPELPVTFGIGKRACIGEAFTMMQVFLFLTTIVKNLNLTLPENVTAVSIEDYLQGKLKVIAHTRN